VLGPGPPPGEFIEIYRFYAFFSILGPAIQPGKPSPKSASTAYPPSGGAKKWKKVKIIENKRFLIMLTYGSDKFITTYTIFRKYYVE
jgi:hypothetical protein